jgi:uncharacterized protein (TIGR02217 family)
MAAFHEVLFPLSLAFGATGGPERRTEIVTLANGREERNSPWAASRRRWNAGVGVRSLDDLHLLILFFEARRARLHGFRWRDPIDWKSCAPSAAPGPLDQQIGVGDGAVTAFQLVKRYESGGEGVDRTIVKPIDATVRVAIDGDEQTSGVDFAVDLTTGLVTLASPPAETSLITAGFEFDTPVRFDVDRLDVSREAFGAGAVPDAPVVEILL